MQRSISRYPTRVATLSSADGLPCDLAILLLGYLSSAAFKASYFLQTPSSFTMARVVLAATLLIAGAWLAAADYPVPIYTHHGKVSVCASHALPPPHRRATQPYDNGLYVGKQAQSRIRHFLQVDDFYKSTIKPFWNSDKVQHAPPNNARRTDAE
jgi:hypothetical protein